MTDYLSAEDLIEINSAVLGGMPAVRDAGLVSSSAMRPATVTFGTEAYPTLEEKAAALLHSVICNHAFVDGNKRTAWTAARVMLALNGMRPDLGDDEAFDLVVRIATSCSEIEVKEIAVALNVVARPAG
ncbi:type II toxin-antitoxin system death-on-curing family toxin [Actinomadura sp. LD22]|uniref:Type II toxin-antitoxin system death-on-curing family toxin n=1 Tax=Actinomadura physcomitrii TaxID=2650748 RepID=A0A6I4MGE5_9ACTN|nr:type II toxin-antitoxin system death-on-curing family toxin [Actinomadura physcomitrii]MWA03970.1 type II toxin-antitoxin system death-on-curing family toxin [Actinomadura physcomitrii]